jgi:molybdate-binding protein/DNA-binding transcriptional regulator YhcF (GntR family)
MNWNLIVRPDGSAYNQIADYVRTQVALGNLKPDERLPAIRELSRELTLDPGTVARAYRELEKEGTIVTRYGKGSFIASATKDKNINELRQKRLGVVVEKAILEALGLGFAVEDIETAFTLHMTGWRERRSPSDSKKNQLYVRNNKSLRFVGSHDIAVELLAVHLSTFTPGVHLTTSFVGSLAGLIALERNEADIAGAHLFDEETGEYNIPHIKKLMPNETVVLINLVQRIQGLMVKPGNPKHILGIRDLIRPDITFVNRQKGSGTRILLDAQLRHHVISPAKVKGYDREETTHSAVAEAITGDGVDVGLGAQSAASAAGIDFIPLVKERYDLIMLKEGKESAAFNLISEVVRGEVFLTMLGSMPGYDTSETGQMYIVSPEDRKGAIQ